MKNQPALWYAKPSLKVIVIFISVWLAGNAMMVLAMTDFFKSGFQPDKHLPGALLLITSTIAVVKLIRNYFRSRTANN